MKERIVIENSVDVSIMKRHPNWEYSQFLIPDKQYKREQVPESFEELKTMCQDLKGVEVYKKYICLQNLVFWYDGEICSSDNRDEIIIAKNRTPSQMWQIIKNLIGE